MFRTHRHRPPANVIGNRLRRHRRILELEGLEERVVLSPTIYTVDATTATGSGTGTTGDLPYVIGQANADPNPDGSLIEFDPTVFSTPQTITLSSTLTLSETAGPEVISGPGAGLVTVSGNDAVEVFSISGGVTATVSGLTISHGSTTGDGGGILNLGTLTVSDSRIAYSSAGFASNIGGGGIDNQGTLTITGTTIDHDQANSGGGILSTGGSVTISDSAINDDSAGVGGGGAIYALNSGELSISGSSIEGDTSRLDGGGISTYGGAGVTISDCVISYNGAPGNGGGIFNNSSTSTLNITDSIISDDASAIGGGVASTTQGASVSIADSTLDNDTGGEQGGGVEVDYGALSITRSTLSNDSVAFWGGGIDDQQGDLDVSDCTLADDTAGHGGGGINDSSGIATIDDSTLADNTVGSGGSGGGGLDVSGDTQNRTVGMATLTNTIIALNTEGSGSDAPSDDISTGGPNGDGIVSSESAYNLIGPGGSGGLTDGSNGNIVLMDLATLGLASLGSYGGPTQTMALLPGSVAIGDGTAVDGITTDQRGVARPATGPDIGAYQDQGFTLTTVAGSTPQSATVDTPFASALAVTVAANDPMEPVDGGFVSFSAPSGGASATLSAATATIGADGQASVMATADGSAGSYPVTASADGATAPASFDLTNLIFQPVFSGLVDQTIAYGTASVELTGTIAAGSQVPTGDAVAITLDGVTQDAVVGSDGSFSTTFATTSLHASATPYVVTYAFAAQGPFLAADGSSHVTVTPASLTITADGESMTYGGVVPPLTATYSGFVNGDTPASLTTPVVLSTTATSQSPVGTYPITASGASSSDYTLRYLAGTLTIAPALLTITAVSQTMPYGGTVPPLTATYSGFVNGDTPASLATPVVLSTTATSDSPAGLYAITASGAGSPNYSIRYVDGTLTIAPPVPPATSRGRAAYGFVTTLYEEVLGRGAEPTGLHYWTREYLGRLLTRVIWSLFAHSRERLGLEAEGRAPTIPLGVAYKDALRASRRAGRRPKVAPEGPLALLTSRHARAATDGALHVAHERPRVDGRD